MLDATAELLMRAGRDPRHVMAMLVPEAWENVRDLDPEVRGFYHYHSALMEPWDGPAGIVFTDGIGVGARLDRNGLRPLRYQVCEDGFIAVCSEVGAIDVSGHGMVQRGRLGPGQMLFVDPTRGFLDDAACKERIAAGAPYAKWAADGFYRVGAGEAALRVPDDLVARQAMHGLTREELAMVLKPMANDAHEPTFSMGDDSPLPNLAPRARPVSHYLRQRFAQVTNPPIDPLRERLVMSLRTVLGPRQPLLTESAEAAELLTLDSFFLYPSGVDALELSDKAPWPVIPLDTTFPASDGPAGLRAAVDRLVDEATAAVDGGAGIVVLEGSAAGPERAAGPVAPRHRGGPPGARRAQAAVAHRARRRGRRRVRRARVRHAAGLRRRRRLPGPRPGDRRRRGRHRRRRRPHQPRGAGPLPGGGRGRRAEDPVQDGHLHRRLVPRRPDLRGGRPRP